MANVVDQDQQWLLGCLSATLDPNQEVRGFAEASLDQAARQPGFLCHLNYSYLKLKRLKFRSVKPWFIVCALAWECILVD